MSEPMISDAKLLAQKYRKRAVLVLGLGSASYAGASYGMTRQDCRAAGRLLDQIGERISRGEISLDGLGVPVPVPVSPMDCKHERRLFIQGGSGGPPLVREHVSLCPDCGQFHVRKQVEGVTVEVNFELSTWELVIAAGQYARRLSSSE